MRVIIKETYDLLCEWVAIYTLKRIVDFKPTKDKPFVIGLPTGSSPLGVYTRLIEYYNAGRLSFKNVVTFNMDEYVNLPKEHPESYHYFMWNNFFSYIDIPKENVNILDGCTEDLVEECNKYEEKIKKVGGIELFLAGVGTDGHLAFNEPGSSLSSRTRIKTLCKETIISNSRFFENDELCVPTTALTVGLGTIMDANEVLVIISGFHKALALKKCLEGNVCNTWTISLLQQHQKSIIVCDTPSTRELKVKTVDYFNNLQETTNIYGQPNHNNLSRFISTDERIVVFSPHPDDDVIGLGGTLQKFDKSNVLIVYMTDGSHGYNKEQYTSNPRKQEAILALKILGYKKHNVKFLELPFYNNNKIITEKDYDMISEFLESIKPHHIFVCADIDPNKTHLKCYEIIRRSKLNDCLKCVWLYNSIWADWVEPVDTVKCTVYLDETVFNRKILSVMMHDSQDPPVVFYSDDQPFYAKIAEKNSSSLNPGFYEEQFVIITKDEFKSRIINLSN
uniref:Glucosamine-6-phosphate isomerases/6-phosphogluconolactonase n=1 Tax=Marseillevirus LCMAC201 TaxID=2506605 RepID=A0A481YW36_9VIRU|nr:MAG: glucosamine-6-phosphate isomerases/6-phosphogluconolactonase [Marseillevirus LCMAC201]